MSPITIPAGQPLHAAAAALGGFSVLSYNILLPNHGDAGWWVFKYYDDAVPMAQRAWEHRQALLREQLLGAMADIVCLQETVADSFEQDLAFLTEAGYAARIHRKYHLRCATFWQEQRWSHVHERHTDKVLTVLLEDRLAGEHLAVVNCHLNAAPDPRRRFRQLFDALDRLRKDLSARSLDPQAVAVVVCGDFNADLRGTATHHLLGGNSVGPAFREARYPESEVSSKARSQPFGPFQELSLAAHGTPRETLFGGRLSSIFPGWEVTEALVQAVDAVFDRFSAEGRMDVGAIDAWIETINGQPGRGSEHRKALQILEESGEDSLSRAQFQQLYRSELGDGKIWSVQHDLQVCGVVEDDTRALYAAALDRMYAAEARLEIAGVWEPLSAERRAQLLAEGQGLPSAWHPSDHLPLGGVFRYTPTG